MKWTLLNTHVPSRCLFFCHVSLTRPDTTNSVISTKWKMECPNAPAAGSGISQRNPVEKKITGQLQWTVTSALPTDWMIYAMIKSTREVRFEAQTLWLLSLFCWLMNADLSDSSQIRLSFFNLFFVFFSFFCSADECGCNRLECVRKNNEKDLVSNIHTFTVWYWSNEIWQKIFFLFRDF